MIEAEPGNPGSDPTTAMPSLWLSATTVLAIVTCTSEVRYRDACLKRVPHGAVEHADFALLGN